MHNQVASNKENLGGRKRGWNQPDFKLSGDNKFDKQTPLSQGKLCRYQATLFKLTLYCFLQYWFLFSCRFAEILKTRTAGVLIDSHH